MKEKYIYLKSKVSKQEKKYKLSRPGFELGLPTKFRIFGIQLIDSFRIVITQANIRFRPNSGEYLKIKPNRIVRIFATDRLENDHTHSAYQRREFSCSIFHKLSGITSISMLYIEHTN